MNILEHVVFIAAICWMAKMSRRGVRFMRADLSCSRWLREAGKHLTLAREAEAKGLRRTATFHFRMVDTCLDRATVAHKEMQKQAS